MATLLGRPYTLGVSSGTAALTVALLACGVGRDDEVIVSAYDWGAAVAATKAVGACPVFADIDSSRLTIDPLSVAEKVSPRTVAIVVTHLYGQPADLNALCSMARSRGLSVIEDCAQALGAKHGKRHVGTLGDAGCYSLGPGKAIAAGEGGLVVFSSESLYNRALELSQHPFRQRAEGLAENPFATNFRLHPLAAAIAIGQLPQLTQRIQDRQTAAAAVGDLLSSCPGLRAVPHISGTTHTYHRYSPTYVPEEWANQPRDVVVRALAAEGVPVNEGFLPAPLPTLMARGPKGQHKAAECYPVTSHKCTTDALGFVLPRIVMGAEPWFHQVKSAIVKVAHNLAVLSPAS
jgi:dTDP-4-amino-4,6-dideoxygalactose transaminase